MISNYKFLKQNYELIDNDRMAIVPKIINRIQKMIVNKSQSNVKS
jgi:hypothetical protein